MTIPWGSRTNWAKLKWPPNTGSIRPEMDENQTGSHPLCANIEKMYESTTGFAGTTTWRRRVNNLSNAECRIMTGWLWSWLRADDDDDDRRDRKKGKEKDIDELLWIVLFYWEFVLVLLQTPHDYECTLEAWCTFAFSMRSDLCNDGFTPQYGPCSMFRKRKTDMKMMRGQKLESEIKWSASAMLSRTC